MTTCWPGYVMAFSKWPSSLAQAMKLPEKVTAPMRTDSTMVSDTVKRPGRAAAFARYSAAGHQREAPPPKPLNTATICGMAVIWTQRARNRRWPSRRPDPR